MKEQMGQKPNHPCTVLKRVSCVTKSSVTLIDVLMHSAGSWVDIKDAVSCWELFWEMFHSRYAQKNDGKTRRGRGGGCFWVERDKSVFKQYTLILQDLLLHTYVKMCICFEVWSWAHGSLTWVFLADLGTLQHDVHFSHRRTPLTFCAHPWGWNASSTS